MSKPNVRYDADHRQKAKAEKSVLFTLDIEGREAGRGRATFQGTLTTPEEVDKVYAFFRELVSEHNKPGEQS